jgi:hypothetical protein
MNLSDHKSISLRWLKNELRNEALKEENEELQKKLWRWYYRAKDAEYEVDILVLKADLRQILKRAVAKGILDAEVLNLPIDLDDDDDENIEAAPDIQKRKLRKPPADDDNLPKQKGFWD